MEFLCKWCGETKPADQFLLRDKLRSPSQSNVRCCKPCNAQRNRDRYQDPVVRAKQQIANRDWKAHNAQRSNELHALWTARNPANLQARTRIAYLLRAGYITRQPCAICGKEPTEGHHDSYARAHWEVVRWLCPEHHEQWHQHLDPLKRPVLEKPLDEAAHKRAQARELLVQIKQLRQQVAALQTQADDMDLEAWTQVQLIADKEFPLFIKRLK